MVGATGGALGAKPRAGTAAQQIIRARLDKMRRIVRPYTDWLSEIIHLLVERCAGNPRG